MPARRPSYPSDQVIERMRARVRMVAAIAVMAVIAATIFESTFAALMRPLVTTVSTLAAR